MLVRDGRDVMLSLMERFPKANPGGRLCLNRWVYDNQAGLAFQHDPRVLVIKLEELTDPMADSSYPVLQKVLRHVGVSATPAIVAHLVGSTDPSLNSIQSHKSQLVIVRNLNFSSNAKVKG